MALNRGFNDEIKALTAEPIQGVKAGDTGDTVLATQAKNLDQPLRMFASATPDAFLNFSASVVAAGDGGFKQLPPISSIGVPALAATKINMGTGAVTGATVTISGTAFATAFAALTKTGNQWRRFAFAVQAAGTLTAAVTAEASTQALLSDYGSLVAGLGGTPVGYIDVQWISAATQYKTPTAATNVIDNSGIYRLPFGGGGSGTGNGNTVLETLKNTMDTTCPYTACMPNTILADGVSKLAVLTGATYDLTTNTIKFTAGSQQIVSTQSLDAYYLANSPADIVVVDLEAFWSYGTATSSFSVPTGFTYEVSRDGGLNYFPVSMTQVPGTNTFYGSLRFDTSTTTEGSSASLATQPSTGGTLVLNTTTQQAVGQAFTLANVVKALTVSLNVVKTGSPTGNLFVSLVKDNSGVPSLLASDIVAQSFAISIAGLATGAVSVTIPGTVLTAATYHILVTTDAAYKAAYAAGTTQLALSGLSSGAAAPFATIYNGTAYSASALDLTYTVLGRALDLRVRITSGGSPTYPCGLDGYGIFYGFQDQGINAAKKKTTSRVFNSVTDNTSTFTITEFALDPDLLKVYLQGSGQVFGNGDFAVSGQTVTFPANTFQMGGVSQTVTLRFDQNTGGSFDGADGNARLLAANHLGSTAAADDRSTAGRGPILRAVGGTLFEQAIDSDGFPLLLNSNAQIVLKTVPDLKNFLLNGNMDFSQRSLTAVAVGPGGSYTVDRWKNWRSGAYTMTVGRSTDVPTYAQSGFQSVYSLIYTNGTGATPGGNDYHQISQTLEGYEYEVIHGGKTCRLQKWFKCSVPGTYSISLYSASRAFVTTFTITSANVWQRYTLDFTTDTASGYNFDNTAGLYIQINLTAGSNTLTSTLNQWYTYSGAAFQGATGQTQWGTTTGATFQIAQAALYQVQAGSGIILPFARNGRNIQQELAACQRYCFAVGYEDSNAGHQVGIGHCIATTNALVPVFFPVPMRAVPTFSATASNFVVGSATNSGLTVTSLVANANSTVSIGQLNATVASGLVAGNATILYRTVPPGQAIFDAEL